MTTKPAADHPWKNRTMGKRKRKPNATFVLLNELIETEEHLPDEIIDEPEDEWIDPE